MQTSQTQTQHHKDILNELVEMAADIARAIHKQATSPNEPKPTENPTISFDRIARTIRKTIALVQALDKPQRPRLDRTQARRKIIRRIEDTIDHGVKVENIRPDQAESIAAEFRERLDAPEFETELATRPVQELIEELIRDLGLDPNKGIFRWKRRTPEDVKILNEVAAYPSAELESPEVFRACIEALKRKPPGG